MKGHKNLKGHLKVYKDTSKHCIMAYIMKNFSTKNPHLLTMFLF